MLWLGAVEARLEVQRAPCRVSFKTQGDGTGVIISCPQVKSSHMEEACYTKEAQDRQLGDGSDASTGLFRNRGEYLAKARTPLLLTDLG
jgi:hypothetical protein